MFSLPNYERVIVDLPSLKDLDSCHSAGQTLESGTYTICLALTYIYFLWWFVTAWDVYYSLILWSLGSYDIWDVHPLELCNRVGSSTCLFYLGTLWLYVCLEFEHLDLVQFV